MQLQELLEEGRVLPEWNYRDFTLTNQLHQGACSPGRWTRTFVALVSTPLMDPGIDLSHCTRLEEKENLEGNEARV